MDKINDGWATAAERKRGGRLDTSDKLNRTEAIAFILARGWDEEFAARIVGRKRTFTADTLVMLIRREAGYQ